MALQSWTQAQIIDQLTSGSQWSGSLITYSFPTSSSGLYTGGGEGGGFTAFNTAQKSAATLTLQLWDDLIAPDMQQVTGQSSYTSANIEYGLTSTTDGYAHAYFPTAGSVWLNSTYTTGSNSLTAPVIGRHGFSTYLHETGHALGLDHMGNYDGAGNWTPSTYEDSTVYTVMSYFGPSRGTGSANGEGLVAWADWVGADGVRYSPQTPMIADILAIQSIYGAETTTRAGDTVYGFNSTITDTTASVYNFATNMQPILAIYDAGGTDTLDLSGWSTPSTITLAPGSFSSANSMTNNISIAYNTTIENATGGSGADSITGNAAANRLVGGAGNDSLYGLTGNDIIVGGRGNDFCDGGDGTDYVYLEESWSSVTCVFNSVTNLWELSSATFGFDQLKSIEFVFDINNVSRELSTTSVTPTDPVSPVPAYAATVAIAAGAASVIEGAVGTSTAYRFTVTLSSASTETETATWNVSLGSAANSASASDFAGPLSGTVTFAAGSTQATIDVLLAGDGTVEADEVFSVALSNLSSGLSLANASASGMIRNDDVQNSTFNGTAYAETLNGTAGNDFLYGNGGNDTLYGNGGNDYLDGGSGSDVMYGGAGDDIYVVNSIYDRVSEAASAGLDTVRTSLGTYTLGSNLEALEYTGSSSYAFKGTGNALANRITGGGGSDTLNGGSGSDTLTGKAGADKFVFNSALGSGNVDTITDFTAGVDRIYLENGIFTGLPVAGALQSGAFNTGTAASQYDDRIIYNPTSGQLFYDADGVGGLSAVHFATLSAGLQLSASSFVVI